MSKPLTMTEGREAELRAVYVEGPYEDKTSHAETWAEVDALRAALAAAEAKLEQADKWARFGCAAFNEFWHEGEPGDIEGSTAQEMALALGLLTRRTEAQATYSCAEGCDWEAGKPFDECECLFPTRGPLRARGEGRKA